MSVIEGGDLTVNCQLTLLVEEVLDSDGPVEIPEGKMVISLADTADWWRQYGVENVEAGDTATLTVSCDPAWNNVVWAVGSLTAGDKRQGGVGLEAGGSRTAVGSGTTAR